MRPKPSSPIDCCLVRRYWGIRREGECGRQMRMDYLYFWKPLRLLRIPSQLCLMGSPSAAGEAATQYDSHHDHDHHSSVSSTAVAACCIINNCVTRVNCFASTFPCSLPLHPGSGGGNVASVGGRQRSKKKPQTASTGNLKAAQNAHADTAKIVPA